jgi:hypothetical protein
MHELLVEPVIEVLVVVKAYPTPSRTYGECVCVAGIRVDTAEPEWVRLYPLNFRGLPNHQRFDKYDVIRLRARRRDDKDGRPESYSPILDTIEIIDHIGTGDGWRARKRYVDPLVVPSMCELQRLQKLDRTSLGVFRPEKVFEIHVTNAKPWDDNRRALTERQSLFDAPPRPLEQLPYEFRFHYRCSDADCGEHTQSLIDWELGQFYRRSRGRPERERLRLVEEKWLHEVCGDDRDVHFFAGNLAKRQHVFVLLGVFWPPRISVDQLALAL